MKKTEIIVFTKLNNVEENNKFLAIKDDNIVKYIDLENNKMIVDMDKNIIIRENSDYLFNMDFNNNKIIITLKNLNKTLEKDIKTMLISNSRNKYLIRYLLTDENIVNEYYVKF
jgi:hypothetical protein